MTSRRPIKAKETPEYSVSETKQRVLRKRYGQPLSNAIKKHGKMSTGFRISIIFFQCSVSNKYKKSSEKLELNQSFCKAVGEQLFFPQTNTKISD